MNLKNEFDCMIECLNFNTNFRLQRMKRTHSYRIKLASMKDKDGYDILHEIANACEMKYENILDMFDVQIFGGYVEITEI